VFNVFAVVTKEREHMANILDQDTKERKITLKKEKKELVDKLEDTINMLNAAAKS
jgi:hypothetical protein